MFDESHNEIDRSYLNCDARAESRVPSVIYCQVQIAELCIQFPIVLGRQL